MIYFLFSLFTWWDYNDNEFDDLKKNSFTKPIFVVCYSKYCPHCSGLPEGTKQYSDGVGNRTEFYVTMLDCSENPGCRRFQITGTPHMVLVIGPNRRYWPRVYSKVGDDWNVFIDKYIYPSLREIKTDEELLLAINEPTDGGSTFHLETYDTNNNLFAELKKLSNKYSIYNDTFIYRINPNIKQNSPQLTVYTSPTCSQLYNPQTGSVEDFIIQNRFGSRHRYDLDEYSKAVKKAPLVTIFVAEELNSAQKYVLKNSPKHLCNNIQFGWISLKKSKNALKMTKKNNSDLPFMFYNYQNCKSVYKGRVIKAEENGFYHAALDRQICGITLESDENLRTNSTQNEGINVTNNAIRSKEILGYHFSIFYVLVGLSLILVFRFLHKDEENKDE